MCQIRVRNARSVRSAAAKQWQPPEGLAPDEILAIIDAASTERDRLLLRVLWATGARISEALALRPMDARRDSLVLPNLKNPSRLTKQVFLPAGQMDLPGALLLWAKEHGLADDEPLFFSRKRADRRRTAADQSPAGMGNCARGRGASQRARPGVAGVELRPGG